MTLCEFFEKFQTFIVGVIGFGGIVLSIWFNAYSSRKLQNNKIDNERNALRTALIAELSLIKDILLERVNTANSEENTGPVLFPNKISTQVYNTFIPKLGLLTPNEIEAILNAYALINELPMRLGLLKSHRFASKHEGYDFIPIESFETAMGVHRKFIPKIDNAIKEIEKNK